MDQVSGEALPSVYGPIKSRRHGFSLGVNVGLTENKICTWSCLYCQCGFGLRRDFDGSDKRVDLKELLSLITAETLRHSHLDAVTLAGNTEPGTYPEILGLVKGLIKLRVMSRAKWKIVILSNGSELDRDEVVQAFNLADEAWLKLDTGTDELFHRLSRPIERVGTLQAHLERLKKLKNLRIQTMLWDNELDPTRANTGAKNQEALIRCLEELNPVQLHLLTVARDPALPGIIPVSKSVLQEIAHRLPALDVTIV